MNCPNCGAGLKIKDNKLVCEYCGYEEALPQGTTPGNDNFFNLVVFNESPNGSTITVSIPECNIGFIIQPGEAVAKDIPPGYHTLIFTCEGMTEYRPVSITGDGKATRVYVSRAALGISIRVVAPSDDTPAMLRGYTNYADRLPVMALVFSILFPIVGIIMAIVDYSNRKSQGLPMHRFTKAAFIVVGVRLALYFLLLLVSIAGAAL